MKMISQQREALDLSIYSQVDKLWLALICDIVIADDVGPCGVGEALQLLTDGILFASQIRWQWECNPNYSFQDEVDLGNVFFLVIYDHIFLCWLEFSGDETKSNIIQEVGFIWKVDLEEPLEFLVNILIKV